MSVIRPFSGMAHTTENRRNHAVENLRRLLWALDGRDFNVKWIRGQPGFPVIGTVMEIGETINRSQIDAWVRLGLVEKDGPGEYWIREN